MSRLIATLALVLALAPASAVSAGCAETVVVDAVSFQPAETRVCGGGTVTWDVRESGHTIVADDGRFAFRGDGTLAEGDTAAHTVGDTGEFIGYHCEIHPSMRGRLVVGDGPPIGEQSVLRVPQDEPSLHDAVIRAVPGVTIDIAPGIYELDRTLEVRSDDIVIRGSGEAPADVVLSGAAHLLPTAVAVSGSHVTLENLTVAGARTTGLHVSGDAVGVTDVHVRGGPLSRDGIVLAGVLGAGLVDVVASGMSRAAVQIRDCPSCGVAVHGLVASDSMVGLHLRDAVGVVVDAATITRNSTGIVAEGRIRPAVVDIHDSVVSDNRRPAGITAADDVLLASGAGVLLSGVADSTVRNNQVARNDGYGIVVAAGTARRTSVTSNVTTGNGHADLAWDGLGLATCFAADGDAVTDPPTLLTTAGCDAAVPASPYNPLVTARVVSGGAL